MLTLLWLYHFSSLELVYQDMLLFLDNFLFTPKLIITSFFFHLLSILDTKQLFFSGLLTALWHFLIPFFLTDLPNCFFLPLYWLFPLASTSNPRSFLRHSPDLDPLNPMSPSSLVYSKKNNAALSKNVFTSLQLFIDNWTEYRITGWDHFPSGFW